MSATRSACAASTALILSQTLFFASADGASPRSASFPFSTWTLLTWTFCAYIASSTDWYFFLRVASSWAPPVPAAPPSSFLSKIPIVSSALSYGCSKDRGDTTGRHTRAVGRGPRATAARQAARPRLPRGLGGRALPVHRGPFPLAPGGPRLPRDRALLAAARVLGPGPGQHDRDRARPVEGRAA